MQNITRIFIALLTGTGLMLAIAGTAQAGGPKPVTVSTTGPYACDQGVCSTTTATTSTGTTTVQTYNPDGPNNAVIKVAGEGANGVIYTGAPAASWFQVTNGDK